MFETERTNIVVMDIKLEHALLILNKLTETQGKTQKLSKKPSELKKKLEISGKPLKSQLPGVSFSRFSQAAKQLLD